MLELRDYQQKAVSLIYDYFRNFSGNPVLEAPTGSGKSLIQAGFIKSVLDQFPDNRFLCLTHQKELISQNYIQLCNYGFGISSGIYSASLNRRDTKEDVIFASIQSVYKRARELGGFDLIIIDECHLCPVKTSDGMYRKFLDDMRGINPMIKIIGLSATPYRLDNGLLIDGSNRLFTDIIPAKAANMDLPTLLDAGYLAPLTTEAVQTRLNTDGVGKAGGEFIASQLAKAVDIDRVTTSACNEIMYFGKDRKKWLIFATSIQHAEHIEDYLSQNHISVKTITGVMKQSRRDQLIFQFKAGQIQCLVNINVLTTGFDVPDIDLIAFMRPTMSASLYMQMAGRGMRIATNKTDCLVLDFAGLIETHGPIDNVIPPKKRKKKGEYMPPLKECPDCSMLLHASFRKCPYCEYKFPINETPKINGTASKRDILSSDKRVKFMPSQMKISIHKKPGKPDSLKISYYDGLRVIAKEWICLFHGGYAQQKAEQWWTEYVGNFCLYEDIYQALEIAQKHARKPDYIYLKKNGEHLEVVSRGFEDAA